MFGRNKKTQEFTISNTTIIRVIFFIVVTMATIRIFENLVHPLTLIFVSFFMALALNPAVETVSKRLKSKSRVRATAISYVAVMSVLIAFFSLVVPPLARQTTEFIQDVPQTLRNIQDDQGAVGEFVRNNNLEEQVSQLSNSWAENLDSIQGPVVSTANRVVSNLISIITVLVLTFMMLVEGPRWLKALWKQYPVGKRDHARKLSMKMYGVVTNYVNGQVIVAAIGALFAIVTLLIASTIFDVSTGNAIALGGIVFLFSLIPTIGAIMSAAVVVLFSSFVSIPLAITMLIYFIVYQQIENVTIQPYIQSRGNELTPMLVFVAAILGIGFGGVLGAFVAIPVAGCAKILLDDYLERKDQDSTE
ncbi:MAG: putative PurR-regulated permease PerM [Candidatus Saccharimonadales bacterium]|jgi:predicted PurR-regulated permease PerM